MVWAIALSIPKVVRRPERRIRQISSHTFILYLLLSSGDWEALYVILYMKKIVLLLTYLSLLVSCSQFDDSEIWEKLNDHEYRIAYLEKICDQLNADIINIQSIVTALENNDYITNASPLSDGSGYILIFKSGKSVVVYNGKDGADGKDAVIPTISVAKDTDGYYYWTIDGEWLLIDGAKVRASAKDGADGKDGVDGADGKDGVDGADGKDGVDGTDGKDGVDGKDGADGITPQFKIENNYWYISYDNGTTWEKLGKATGSNGLDGVNGNDGDSMFKKVYVENGYVCFELNDSTSTIIRIPLMKDGTLKVSVEKEGTLSRLLTSEETRTTTSLIITGRINTDDMRHIQIMNNLQKLDLSEASYECIENTNTFIINPYQDTLINKSLEEIIFPKTKFYNYNNSYCLGLKKITISSDIYHQSYSNVEKYKARLCPNVTTVEYAEGVTVVEYTTYWESASSIETIIYPSTLIHIPYTLTITPPHEYGDITGYKSTLIFKVPCKVLVCKANTPPTLEPNSIASGYGYSYEHNGFTKSGIIWTIDVPEDAVLYVPKESIELYKEAPLWEAFTNIKAIEEM